MKEEFTLGIQYHPGYTVLARISDDFSEPLSCGDHFSIILAEKGACVLNFNGKIYPVNAPFLICANEKEKISFIEKGTISGRIVKFHPKAVNISFEFNAVHDGNCFVNNETEHQDFFFLNPFLERRDQYMGIIQISTITAGRLTKLISSMSRELQEQYHQKWPCRSRSFLLEMLCTISNLYLDPDPTHEISYVQNENGIFPILLYIHTRYQEKITIETLCREFHTNRTSLQNKFYSLTGKNIKTYLQDLRIQISSLMLRDTLISIKDIADRTGYGDLNHFSRSFRLKTGYTPTDYRQKTNWMLHSA
jgi:AraC family L-rhamnose operon regulatory protein RhaS